MAELRLPAGLSLRQVAETLGVTVEELQQHTELEAEAVAPVDRVVQVPDGFLRSRAKSRELRDAVTQRTDRKAGMNMWLAMDIEQKKTRIETALGYGEARREDMEALRDAISAFERFDAESNRLAIDLAAPLATRARSLELRGVASSLAALAHAATYRWYGAAPRLAKLNALSAAKGALLANPRMARAKVAMGAALSIDAGPEDRAAAVEELFQAVQNASGDGFAWAYLADVLWEQGDADGADAAARRGIEASPRSSFAAEVAGRVFASAGDHAAAVERFRAALTASASNTNANLQLGFALLAVGRSATGKRELQHAIDATRDPDHRRRLEKLREIGRWRAASAD